MTTTPPPLAFVYDRCATRRHHQLDMRLAGCRIYAERMDWVLAGRWTDLGSHALSTTRPQLAALLEAMRAESGRREVLCLVHNWGRLASTPVQRLALRRLVTEAGGWTTTTFGESDRKALTVRVKHGD